MVPILPAFLDLPLARFLELLDQWNRIHALTALAPADRHEELLLDAAALLPFLASVPAGSRVADLGTGMGIPAVVLALARPDLTVLGVDASGKKLAFLRQAALEIPIPNLSLLQGRLESLPPLEAHWGTAKALAPVPQLLAWWARHGTPGAPFLALKGIEAPEAVPPGWEVREHPYELPTRGHRRVLELRPAET